MPDDNEIDESSDIVSEDDYDETENIKNEHDDNIMGDQSYLTDGDGAAPVKKAKVDPKDPSRPRRKKARRACFACQRAHLTCGKLRQVLSILMNFLAQPPLTFAIRHFQH